MNTGHIVSTESDSRRLIQHRTSYSLGVSEGLTGDPGSLAKGFSPAGPHTAVCHDSEGIILKIEDTEVMN